MESLDISESEFMANEDRRLKELSGLIRLTGMPAAAIARDCNLDRRTVQRAMEGLPLKSDATERIKFYIKKFLQHGIQTD